MPSTFHQFNSLPAELRIQIWCYALEEIHIVRVRINQNGLPYRRGYSSPLLRTCSESRAIAIANQHDPKQNHLWDKKCFSYDRSILYFGSANYHERTYANSHCLNNLEPGEIKYILFLYRPTGLLADTSHEVSLITMTLGNSCRYLKEIILCPISGDGRHDPIPRDIDCMSMVFPDSASCSISSKQWRLYQPRHGSWDLGLQRGERRMLRKLEGSFSRWKRNGGFYAGPKVGKYEPPRVKFLRLPVEGKQEPYWGLGFFLNLLGSLLQLSSWTVGSKA